MAVCSALTPRKGKNQPTEEVRVLSKVLQTPLPTQISPSFPLGSCHRNSKSTLPRLESRSKLVDEMRTREPTWAETEAQTQGSLTS